MRFVGERDGKTTENDTSVPKFGSILPPFDRKNS